jgi:hypothetical protein
MVKKIIYNHNNFLKIIKYSKIRIKISAMPNNQIKIFHLEDLMSIKLKIHTFKD